MKRIWQFAMIALTLTVLISPSLVAQDPAPTTTTAPDPAADKLYRLAVTTHNADAFDMAAEQWQRFITEYPDDPRAGRATHYLGICQFQEREFEKAADTFASVVAKYPDLEILEETYYDLGLAQYNVAIADKPELFDQAAKTFETLISKYPEDANVPESLFYAGECYYKRTNPEKAAEKYAALIKDHANHRLVPQAMLALGVAQADINKAADALKTYDDMLKKYPDHALATEATMWRGDTLYTLGRFEEAEATLAGPAATDGFSMADYATVRLADAKAALGQKIGETEGAAAAAAKYAEAAATYASVLTKFKNSRYAPVCRLEAGKKYYAAGDFEKTTPYLTDVVAAGGESAIDASHWLARAQLKTKQPAEALKTVETILPAAAGSPLLTQLLMDQADAIYDIPARRNESIALFASLAKDHPDSPLAPQAQYMAASTAMNQGQYDNAITHAKTYLEKYADADPNLTIGVKHALAESLLLKNDCPAAENLYRELLAAAPNDPDASIWKVHLGTALYLQANQLQTQGKTAEAQTAYQATIDALAPILADDAPPIADKALLAEAWYRIGKAKVAQGKLPESIAPLREALAAAPKWILADDAHLVLAYALQQTGDLDSAAQEANIVITDFPASELLDMAHFRVAESSRLGKNLDKAISEYEIVLADWPSSPLVKSTYYGLAWAQLGQGRNAEADKSFTMLIDAYPQDRLVPRSKYGRGMVRQQLARGAATDEEKAKWYTAAAADLEAFLATNPTGNDKARALHLLALSQKGAGETDKAATAFEELIAEASDYPDLDGVYYELALLHRTAGKDDKASEILTELVAKFPDSKLVPDSQYLVGDYAYKQGNFKNAAQSYYAAMLGAKESGNEKLAEESAYNLGLTYYNLEDYPRAQGQFAYQRRTWPTGTLAANGALMEGEALFKQQRYAEALAAYETAGESSDEKVESLRLLHAGHAAAELPEKDWKKSLEMATKCATRFPDSPYVAEAVFLQARATHQLGDPAAAKPLYRKVVDMADIQEVAAKALFWIGEIQFADKEHSDAILTFFDVSANYGYPKWQAKATYEAARCFEVQQKVPQAIRQYQRLVEKFPESPEAPIAAERIKLLEGQ